MQWSQGITVAKSSWLATLVISWLVVCSGCGESVPVAEVEGTVKLNGKPVDKIQVEFWPVGTGVRSVGTTDAEGRFKLMTDDGTRAGAAIGSHKVVLHDVGILGDKFLGRAGEDADMAQGKKPRISSEYADPEKSSLKAEVVFRQKERSKSRRNCVFGFFWPS